MHVPEEGPEQKRPKRKERITKDCVTMLAWEDDISQGSLLGKIGSERGRRPWPLDQNHKGKQ